MALWMEGTLEDAEVHAAVFDAETGEPGKASRIPNSLTLVHSNVVSLGAAGVAWAAPATTAGSERPIQVQRLLCP